MMLKCHQLVFATAFIAINLPVLRGDNTPQGTTKITDSPLGHESASNDGQRNVTREIEAFKMMVKLRHSQRLQAVKDIMHFDYAKQYKMLDTIFQKLFEGLLRCRVTLEGSGFIAGGEWPANTTVKDAMTVAIESTLFFGEMVLRLPHITHRILKAKKDWEILINWSWALSNESLPILDEKLRIPITLMAQELGIVEKDPDYINRFKEENPLPGDSKIEKIIEEIEKRKKKKKPKKTRERGPMLTSPAAGDL